MRDYRYVILDDIADMLLSQRDNFIQINPNSGITEAYALKAIEILTIKK